MKVQINKPKPTTNTYDILGLTEAEMWALRYALLELGPSTECPSWGGLHDAIAGPMDFGK